MKSDRHHRLSPRCKRQRHEFRWESLRSQVNISDLEIIEEVYALRTEADEPYGKKQDQDEQVTFCKS